VGTPVLAGFIALGVYSLLLAVGGGIGYVKAGSRPSLVAGLASAVATVAALAAGLVVSPRAGFGIGLLIAVALIAVFSGRWRKTGKFMPAGMLCLISAAMALGLAGLLLTLS
jgi:uncharacterized membrane protein (UPF0136 family)